jgi:hypothetical protein
MRTRPPTELPDRAPDEAGGLPARPPRAVTLRAVAIGLLLIPLNAYWILQIEVIRFISWPTILSLQVNVLFLVFALAAASRIAGRLFPRAALSAGEVVVVYLMLSLATVLCGTDFSQVLLATIAYPAYYASPGNRWDELFLPYMPDWLVVKDRAALEGFFVGSSSLYEAAHWRAWAVPLLAWLSFVLVLVWTMICVGALLRRHWNEHERLSYPIAQVPLALATNERGLFTRPLFWAGFAIAALVDLWNGVHILIPAVPDLATKGIDLAELFDPRMQRALGGWPVAFYPFAIGLGMLMPLDLCFSLWFFYLALKGERLITALMAWDADPRAPYLNEQSSAAWIAVAVALLGISRRHLARMVMHAWEKSGSVRRPHEPMSPRTAVLGMGFGWGYLLLFSARAGMPVLAAVLFFLVYLLIAITLTRFRAESGAIAHDHFHGGPGDLAVLAAGSGMFSPRLLTLFTLYFWFNRSYGTHPMPFAMEGFYLGERVSLPGRWLVPVMLLAVVAGYVAFFWISLDRMYHLGAASANVNGDLVRAFVEAYPRLGSWITSPTEPHLPAIAAMTGAFFFTLFLTFMRMHALYWPFHPVGFALATTWSMDYLWASLLVSWMCNVFVVRYGGVYVFRRARPFYFGLILGEATFGSLWALAGILLGVPTYSFWP